MLHKSGCFCALMSSFKGIRFKKTKTFSWVVILISVFVKMGTEGLGGAGCAESVWVGVDRGWPVGAVDVCQQVSKAQRH